jgi:hypothetical protein
MSDSVTLPHPLIESASDAAPAPSLPAAPVVGTLEPGIASAPILALAPTLPPETQALLELIGRGLAPEADASTRDAARDLWARFAQTMATAAPVTPTAPVMPAAPVMPMVPWPTSPIAMAARTLRQLPPDQLLDLVLQRLRASLPAGATVPTPKGIQFPLVPVAPPGSR